MPEGFWYGALPACLRGPRVPPLWLVALAGRRKPLLKGGTGGMSFKRRTAAELTSGGHRPSVAAALLGVSVWTFRGWLKPPRKRS